MGEILPPVVSGLRTCGEVPPHRKRRKEAYNEDGQQRCGVLRLRLRRGVGPRAERVYGSITEGSRGR